MHTVASILDRFEMLLHAHVAQVLDLAAGSPAGGADRWDALMGMFGLQPAVPRAERGAVAGRRGHPRGAFPEDVEQVLHRLGHDARGTLHRIGADYHRELHEEPSARARFDALAAHVATLPATQRAAYEASLRPSSKTGAGLAGIFANARATAEISPWNKWKQPRQVTLQCRGCGAAQSAELVFTCKFCGNNLFGRET